MRYVFNRPTIWVTELSQYFMIFIAFLGLGYTELQNKHTRVDLFTTNMPKSLRKLLHKTQSPTNRPSKKVVQLDFLTCLSDSPVL